MRRAAPWLAADVISQRHKMPGVLRMEAEALDISGREVSDSPALRPMPLVVLSAGQFPAETSSRQGANVRSRRGLSPEFWLGLQLEIADQLPDSRFTIVHDSGHFIQFQQPTVVSAAVREMILDLRLREWGFVP